MVEDNADLREHLELVLRPVFDVVTAEDGQAAWERLEREHDSIDLILSDIMMPRLDGFELLDRLKNHPHWRTVPVIMLTARTDEADRLRGLRLGVDDYLGKPFSTAELLARSANLIERYRARQDAGTRHDQGPDNGETTVLPAFTDRWLEDVETLVRQSIENAAPIRVPELAMALGVSERSLHRKLKELTGLSPVQYILEARLARARQLLEARAFATVREVCFAVGFDTPHYFSRVYERRYGRAPGSYFE